MNGSNKKIIVAGVLALVVVIGGLLLAGKIDNGPSIHDKFAQCIKDSGAKFFGTFWCPHCQNQKKIFGNAKQYLPYIECSTADAKGQLPICATNEIMSYPTWVFPDNSTSTGEQTLENLSVKTSCELPTVTKSE